MVDLLGALFKARRADEFAKVDRTLERLLRRAPVTMRQVLVNTFERQQ